ncbi:MAG: hypothetical protein R3Y08_04895 [Rikenellaceae bacterium]
MENKLQVLTQKLYDQGLEKGRQEADLLVGDAKAKAAKIVEDATAEAAAIIKKAQATAEDTQKNSMTEIALAGKQAIAKIKSELENAIVTKSTADSIKAATIDPTFIKEMLLAVAVSWNGADSSKISLEALLPEAQKAQLDGAITKSAAELLAAGVEVGYSKQVSSGFKVGAKGGGYYISFSDEDFDALMRGYIREKLSAILFKA